MESVNLHSQCLFNVQSNKVGFKPFYDRQINKDETAIKPSLLSHLNKEITCLRGKRSNQ